MYCGSWPSFETRPSDAPQDEAGGLKAFAASELKSRGLTLTLQRRTFLSLICGAVASLPRRSVAQGMPKIGFLHPATVEAYVSNAAGFARGLKDAGFAEAANVAIAYRFANGRLGELATLAADLVREAPAVIVAGGAAAAMAAAHATSAIPIVFVSGHDPVRLRLVASLTKPGGNVTGAIFATTGLVGRKLELIRALVPGAKALGYLGDSGASYGADSAIARAFAERKDEIVLASQAAGLQVVTAEIGTEHDYDTAFVTFAERRIDALIVGASAILANDAEEIVALAERNRIPTLFERRSDIVSGGLLSYGDSRAEAWRLCGAYAGRILGGASPATIPVVRTDKRELAINLRTAKMLSLTIDPGLIAQADAVIE
jgi:putative tryptophan/tyrosine transport system substrate-binding protein